MNRFERILVQAAIDAGWFRCTSIEFILRSGRKFRYQMQDYPFRVFAFEGELDALCCQIIKDKYRYCEWDREHPRTNSEVEIFDAIKKWMMGKVAKARELQAEIDSVKNAHPKNS